LDSLAGFFIPSFFMVVGFLIVPSAVAQTLQNLLASCRMIASLILGTGMAAAIAGRLSASGKTDDGRGRGLRPLSRRLWDSDRTLLSP
jgi:Kef-type K+ transport system membrane component KefB